MALSGRETGGLDDVGWKFGFKLKTEHIWDAFVLLSLLHDSSAHTRHLELPQKGFQHSRFTKAMEERNERIVLEGQDEIGHSCDKCTRYYELIDADGTTTTRKCLTPCVCVTGTDLNEFDIPGVVRPVMTDGLYMGHLRCAVPPCRDPLAKSRHRFCTNHFAKHDECAVRTCSEPVLNGSKMCADPKHQKMEALNQSRGNAPFQLSRRMQKMHVTHPNDSMLTEVPKNDKEPLVDDLEENIAWFEVDGDDVRIFREQNLGGIGEEDVPDDAEDGEV